MLRTTHFLIGFALILAFSGARASAQDDPEEAGRARGGYAWGEGPSGPSAVALGPEDPLRILAWAGAGLSVRLIKNLDFGQDSQLAPGYLQLGGAVFFPGRDFRHGVGLGIAANLTADASVQPMTQWVLAPTYHVLVPLRYMLGDTTHDWLTLHGQLGVALGVSPAFAIGLTAGFGVIFKFLAGLGLYADLHFELYGGGADALGNPAVHPIVSLDGGLVFDYEVLP
ncbi:MAG: hypothetical protein K8H88_00345 [Sandaracinaceae bacterium]|nr:hypothetical protein [Sandaracinaceae bacterium]